MVKKTLVAGIMVAGACLIFLIDAVAQNKELQNSQFYKHYQMQYIFGRKYNDGDVMKNSLYALIALDPNDDSLKVNLAYYYIENNQYPSSLFVTADILSRNSNNREALRINAISYENMGLRDKAISQYESLYLLSNDLLVLYQIAMLQYELSRPTECNTNLDIIIKNPQAKTLKLNFPKTEREQQAVTLEAGSYYLKGMVELERGNKAEAKKQFEKALEVQSDFEEVKRKIAEL